MALPYDARVSGDLRFGPYELRRDERLLFREGDLVALTPRAIDLLLLLIEADGRLVTKDEILTTVWAGSIVEEANIAHQISTIRKALGDEGETGTRYIETLPRRGYRFVGKAAAAPLELTVVAEAQHLTVTEEDQRSWSTRRAWLLIATILLIVTVALIGNRWWESRGAPIRSLAVLPFESIDGDQGDEFLKVAMADALINRLSSIGEISVRPITAVRSITSDESKDVTALARRLQVEAVLEGSVQRSGDRLRVTSRLIRASNGRAIWSGKFDEQSTNLFALQDALTEKVAHTLVPAIRGKALNGLQQRHTPDPEAYELYLRGRGQWSTFTTSGRLESIAYYGAAIKKDPEFALPWVGLSNAYSLIGIYGPLKPVEAFAHAKEAASKALALDPVSAEAQTALGIIDLMHSRKWEEARQTFTRVLAIKEDIGARAMLGYYLQAAGRPVDALEQFRKEREIDPVWHVPQNDGLLGLVLARRWEEAIRESNAVLAIDPRRTFAFNTRGMALAQLGRTEEALQDFRTATRLGSQWARAEEGWVLGQRGDRAGALRLAEELKKIPDWNPLPFYLAEIYAGIGDYDEAMRNLERADAERYPFLFRIRVSFEFDPLRSDPRFVALERRLNLPR